MNEKQHNPIPQGQYVSATRAGELIFTAGMTPRKDGVLLFSGKVQAEEPLDNYRGAVRQATLNALIAARNMLSAQEDLKQVLSLTVYINATEGFTEHARLADYASELLVQELGQAGVGSRAAIGVATLPGNAPVEVQMVVLAGH